MPQGVAFFVGCQAQIRSASRGALQICANREQMIRKATSPYRQPVARMPCFLKNIFAWWLVAVRGDTNRGDRMIQDQKH
jgi:hypothetical protein